MRAGAGEQDNRLISVIESILLVADGPVTPSALAAATGASRGAIEAAIADLVKAMQGGIRVQHHDGRVQLVTAPENTEVVQRFLGAERPPPLSRAALETLTVVAYHQPVTRAEVDAIRGVDSDHSFRRLLARGLIEERGRRDVVGRPAEYGTTARFLEYFGLASLDDLPQVAETDEGRVAATQLGLREPE